MTEIALAGNPNSGKTTLFNAITGGSLEVGNWAGVTIEKKEGRARKYPDINVIDLPGIYAMSAHSEEEKITGNYLTSDSRPDVIINVVDAVNIERNLFFTTQLLELGIPVVIALNRSDMVKKDMPDINMLRRLLCVPVVVVSAIKGIGIDDIMNAAVTAAKSGTSSASYCRFPQKIEKTAIRIERILRCGRYKAIRLIEKGYCDECIDHKQVAAVNAVISGCVSSYGGSAAKILITVRYSYVHNIISRTLSLNYDISKETLSDRIDRIALGRYTAIPIFVIIIGLIYYLSVIVIGNPISEWLSGEVLAYISDMTEKFLVQAGAADFIAGIVCGGIISGVGGVLCFLPQLSILLFLMGLLEDCGYMSRIAFVADRLMRYVGLSGKSVISLLLGSGCSVPGILSCRTIENSGERSTTVVTTPFIPCSAKLTVIILLAGAALPGFKWLTMLTVYLLCIASVGLSAFVFNRFIFKSDYDSCFIMELPDYKIPSFGNTFKYTLHKLRGFILKALTIIFIACIVIWLLSNYNTSLVPSDLDESALAKIGKIISPVFAPLGWGSWRMVSAMLCGLIAKENIIGTLRVLSDGPGGIDILLEGIGSAGVISYLIFNLLCIPCVASIAAMRKELGGKKFAAAVIYQSLYAYAVSYVVYRAADIAETGSIPAIVPFVLIILLASSGVILLGRALHPKQNKSL